MVRGVTQGPTCLDSPVGRLPSGRMERVVESGEVPSCYKLDRGDVPLGWICGRRLSWLWSVVTVSVLMGSVLLSMPTLAQASAEAPAVEEVWVAEVSSSGATLYAKIDPKGNATTYKLEYGEGEFGGSAGDGPNGVVVEAHPQTLKPRTVYSFRVVAESSGGKGEGEAQFTTQSAGGELKLPDGRMWELVSPPTKDGALIEPIGEGAGLIQAAEGGGAIAYLSAGPAKSGQEAPPGNANDAQLLAVRGMEGGWSSRDIATPHEVSTGISTGSGQEYRWFSPDLAIGLVEPFGSGRGGEEAEGAALLSESASEKTIYLRADAPLPPEPSTLEGSLDLEAESEGDYLPLVTGCPVEEAKCKAKVKARANVPPGTQFGAELEFLSATPDADHVVLHSFVPLRAGAERNQLYEWTAGTPTEQLQLVSVLPGVLPYKGEQAPGALGYNGVDTSGAVSSDGSRIVWTSEEGHLLMRNMSSKQTVQLDVPESGEGNGKGDAQFQFASSDGSKVFFTDGEHLTATSTTNSAKPDLYVCEIVEVEEEDKKILKCDLSDLTASEEGADVQGTVVPDGSEGSYVPFVANGVLTEVENAEGVKASLGHCGGNPPPGATCNLYMRHYNEGSKAWEPPVFIASLSSKDRQDWDRGGDLEEVTSRVSPNGEYMTFMSERSLTGYDNKDVNSGEPDEEVYLYRASVAGAPSGRLVCVSCNPTGERPAGVLDPATTEKKGALLTDEQSLWGGRWLAANVPGWTAISLERARYQSRYVSDGGRVFFDSSDSLVPQATNGLMDLFEYEPAGVGDCEASSGSFSISSGGCVGLVSSGSSAAESAFLDASASGEDVFFLTSTRLVPEDRDTAFDVYDAHVCSGVEPCVAEAVSLPPCETADSCRVAPSLQPSVFGAPASATFSGPENPVATGVTLPPPAIRCSKGKRLSHGRCVKVKRRRGKKARAGRTGRDRGGKR